MMPPGVDNTVPLPVPSGVTVRAKLLNVNEASIVVADVIVVTHEPVPVQPPPVQPVNIEPGPGTAVRVTAVPTSNCWVQSALQSIPDGDEVITPPPVPDRITV